jgi:hypothetical protein
VPVLNHLAGQDHPGDPAAEGGLGQHLPGGDVADHRDPGRAQALLRRQRLEQHAPGQGVGVELPARGRDLLADLDHLDHQRGGVVLAAAIEGQLDQPLRGPGRAGHGRPGSARPRPRRRTR